MSSSGYFYSNCITLEEGCFLRYWNGTTWVDAEDAAGVVGGKFSDGQYCYNIANGIITTKDICTYEVELVVRYESDRFYANLYRLGTSVPQEIDTTLTISASSLNVNGYEDSSCSIFSSETDAASSDLVISANSTSGYVMGTYGLTPPPGGTTQNYNFPSTLFVNGTARYDTDVFTVGNGIITIYYGGCSSYVD